MAQRSLHLHHAQDIKYEQGVLPRLREVLGGEWLALGQLKIFVLIRNCFSDILECPAPKPRGSHNRFNDRTFASSSHTSTSQVATAVGPCSYRHKSIWLIALDGQKAQLPPIKQPTSPKAEKHSSSSSRLLPTGGSFKKEFQAECASPFGESAREEYSHTLRNPHTSQSPPTHSYDVFLLTSEQELSHKRSSRRDDHYDVTKELAISSSSGKYSCTECGRRFQKNSTLKVGSLFTSYKACR